MKDNEMSYGAVTSYSNMTPQITIREVCNLLGIGLPTEENTDSYEFIDIDRPCTVCTTTWSMRENAIVMLRRNGIDVYQAVNGKASMILGDFAYRNTDAYSVKYPEGLDAKSSYTKVCAYIRAKYDIPAIAITGNAGKTTTKDLISSIMSRKMNTLFVNKNYNTTYTTGELIQNLNDGHELYIQEVHEPHSDYCSEMVKPDVVVLTNLERAHLDETGASTENSIRATLRILDNMKPEGIIFANNDCKFLSEESFDNKKVVRYSAYNDECDYWASDIENHGLYTSFLINSRYDEPIECRLNISGVHNVNNAVGAYAVGRYFNISPAECVAAMESYRPDGVRQNLIEKDGRFILMDCYSITVLSSVAAAKNLCELPLKPGGKRVLVLSYLPTLGAGSESVHRDVGKAISEMDIDLIVGYRNDVKYVIDECQKAGKNAVFFQYHKDMIEYLEQNLNDNDNIVFKGVTFAHLEQVANKVLGLSIVPENSMEADRKSNGGDW